jgi:cell division protein FtsQ
MVWMIKMAAPTTRRSDQIRTKRKDQSRPKPLAGRRKAKLTSPAIPPVMARGGLPVQSYTEIRHVRKARRRFDLTLGAAGTEMRLPAIPQIHFGWRVISLVLLAAFSYGLFTLWNSPEFHVDGAHISGLKHVTEPAVNAVLGLAGQPVFTLDAAYMERLLQDEFHEFSSAKVSVSLPNSVAVTVTERIPVLIWMQDGRTNMVDENGVTFPAREGSEEQALPKIEANASPPAPALNLEQADQSLPDMSFPIDLMTASSASESFIARPLLTPEMVTAVLLMAKNAPQDAVLMYTAENGLMWQDKRGWNVYFGAPAEMEMKLHVYKTILDHLKSQDTRPEMISVEFLTAPYYRLANQ